MNSSWDFLPFGCSGVFVRPSHASECDRKVETPLTVAVHWVIFPHDRTGHSPLIKSRYFLVEHIGGSSFKRRPISRRTPGASGSCRWASLGTRRDLLLTPQRFVAPCRSCTPLIPASPIFSPSSKRATYSWAKLRHLGMTIVVRFKTVSPCSYVPMPIFHIGRS